MSKKILEYFFAVTMNSIYKVVLNENNYPFAHEIDSQDKLTNGMLAISKNLQFYNPEKHSTLSSKTSVKQGLEHVNTQWWGQETSDIVALFLDEKEASDCSKVPNTKPYDSRWIKQTKKVIEAIRQNHPDVTVCYDSDLRIY